MADIERYAARSLAESARYGRYEVVASGLDGRMVIRRQDPDRGRGPQKRTVAFVDTLTEWHRFVAALKAGADEVAAVHAIDTPPVGGGGRAVLEVPGAGNAPQDQGAVAVKYHPPRCTCGQALTPNELQPRDPWCPTHGKVERWDRQVAERCDQARDHPTPYRGR